MSRIYPCVHCTEDGYCKKFSDEEVISWCVQGPCKDERPSNADKLRSMSDEELAEKIGESIDCEVCKTMHHSESGECPIRPHQACVDFWLDWLRQEAPDA